MVALVGFAGFAGFEALPFAEIGFFLVAMGGLIGSEGFPGR
jgi:hypothetical protein